MHPTTNMEEKSSMKISRLHITVVILLLGFLLSSCTGALPASGWPVVSADSDMAYVASGAEVFGVRLNDGSMAWRFPEKADPQKGYYSTPTLTPDGQLLIAGYDHKLYSLNPKNNGQVNWTFQEPKNRLIGSPLATDEGIYQPSTDHQLYALDLKGAKRWTFSTQQPLWATPVANGNNLYQSSMDHFLYAIRMADGSKVWATDLGGALPSGPTLSPEGILYVGTLSKEMIAVNATNGRIVWRIPTTAGVWSSPALHEGILYFGDSGGKFYAIDTANGKVVWQNEPGGVITGSPALIENGVVFGTETGALIALDFSGKTLWNQPINGKLYSSPVAAGDLLVVSVTGGDNLLVAYDHNGNQRWPFTPPK